MLTEISLRYACCMRAAKATLQNTRRKKTPQVVGAICWRWQRLRLRRGRTHVRTVKTAVRRTKTTKRKSVKTMGEWLFTCTGRWRSAAFVKLQKLHEKSCLATRKLRSTGKSFLTQRGQTFSSKASRQAQSCDQQSNSGSDWAKGRAIECSLRSDTVRMGIVVSVQGTRDWTLAASAADAAAAAAADAAIAAGHWLCMWNEMIEMWKACAFINL